MKKGFTLIELLTLLAIVLILVAIPLITFIQASQESKTYNKLTGTSTTWWDALWVELRVQGTSK